MANVPSAEKRNRQRIKRRVRNLYHLTTMRTYVKRVRATGFYDWGRGDDPGRVSWYRSVGTDIGADTYWFHSDHLGSPQTGKRLSQHSSRKDMPQSKGLQGVNQHDVQVACDATMLKCIVHQNHFWSGNKFHTTGGHAQTSVVCSHSIHGLYIRGL